jgi:hypothetical protein
MEEDKRKHLEFIQNVITRMNTNSFQIKSLAITLVTALMAVYVSTPKVTFLFIGILPTFLFWFLDSYYLKQERKFRGVYNDVAGINEINEVKIYEMPINKYKGNGFSFIKVFWSKTIAWLYGSIIAFLIIIGLLMIFKDRIF